jgi:predicted ATPase
MILNFFYDQFEEKKIKLHFNEFMIEFHDFVFEKKKKKKKIYSINLLKFKIKSFN